ncbi:LysR family transcriptional regulator, partial [Bordetella pertussis]
RAARAEDLSLHNCLTHSYFGRSLWRFERAGEPVEVPVGGNITANETDVLMRAALAGAGIVMLPTYLAAGQIAAGSLRLLLPDCAPPVLGIHGVYVSRKQMPLILRTMLDFLAERFSPAPWDAALKGR